MDFELFDIKIGIKSEIEGGTHPFNESCGVVYPFRYVIWHVTFDIWHVTSRRVSYQKMILKIRKSPTVCMYGKILFTLYGTGPFWGPSGAHAAATLAAACSARAQQLRRPQIPDAVGGGNDKFPVEYWPQMWPTPKNRYD